MIVNDDRFYGGKALVLKADDVPENCRKFMFSANDTQEKPGSSWGWFGNTQDKLPKEMPILTPERIYNTPTVSHGWNIGIPHIHI